LNTIFPGGGSGPPDIDAHRSGLSVHIIRKAYRAADGVQTEVLRDLAFTLAPGTFTCLIGPSGSGKTTTLRILLGLDQDFDGIVGLDRARQRVAAVFQEPRLLPWRTVDQNVRLALPDGASVDLVPLYETLGLTGMGGRYPAELSLGLERRVALARAFAVMPDILLLDEPFVSLDEHIAGRLRELAVELARAHGVTVLMVTHNLREAVQMADNLLLVNGQPAQIVGEAAITVPRQRRHGAELEALVADLARRHPATLRA
jgi:NitT/TauT family transport system ATP-binding protein